MLDDLLVQRLEKIELANQFGVGQHRRVTTLPRQGARATAEFDCTIPPGSVLGGFPRSGKSFPRHSRNAPCRQRQFSEGCRRRASSGGFSGRAIAVLIFPPNPLGYTL